VDFVFEFGEVIFEISDGEVEGFEHFVVDHGVGSVAVVLIGASLVLGLSVQLFELGGQG